MFHDGSHGDIKPQWEIKTTNLFYPLYTSEVLIHPRGDVYIVKFTNAKVLHFGTDGKKIADIDGKGEGPGEFIYPGVIGLRGDNFWVMDYIDSSFTIFSREGKVTDTLKPPLLHIDVVQGGESFEKRTLQLGEPDGDRVQILVGLAAGERIVVKGADQVHLASKNPKPHGHKH